MPGPILDPTLTRSALVRRRWRAQGLAAPLAATPEQVVAQLGAVQAQEYAPAKWALGLRCRGGMTEKAVERAIDQGRILRTHLLRPTWHFVTATDIRWILELTAPQVHRRMATYDRQLGLHAPVMTRAAGIIERALGGGGSLTRRELGAQLERAGLPGKTRELAHIMMHAELEGLICSGPRRGKQFTYALLSERAPTARPLPREEALAELARRYFRTHGPATIRDFVWWSGLSTADARRGLEMNKPKSQEVDGVTYWTVGPEPRVVRRPESSVHLLPVYDEYLVAYRDQTAVPRAAYVLGSFQHALVIGGQVAGSWKPRIEKDRLLVEVSPDRRLSAAERREVAQAVARYQSFLT
jgi:Winged helix DNA-binding domain